VRISYGKLRVPVHRIDGDAVLACEVSVEVLGDNFLPAYTEGDNANVVATDTMKNFILRESLTYDDTSLEGLNPFCKRHHAILGTLRHGDAGYAN